ncbi:hypothetical protein [Microlunatus soli]|uniref:CHAD domain-containing protein n=1 Tax=Microlunatus soli TaxID=630515 RepID=A0A1H1SUF1_9ACTN|nr:hypothetical protein [Microlunatus soli]SDS51630.1 hypothetical protein SAMN04489812_2144 [Microlunatus soli]
MTAQVWRFDLPYTTEPARLDNVELGLPRPVARAGRDAAYAAEVTLLDVADHRLIRSGIELAHRVIEGRGDWYLRAPSWHPLLPDELVEPFGKGDLPERLSDLTMPFRRRGALGPVAAISHQRQSFEFRSGDEPTAVLRDDRVTVRRGGVTTARFREVRIEAGPAGLKSNQQEWLIGALEASGGTLVEEFPSLAQRIGTPATGLTDYPAPRPIEPDAGFENFIESVVAGRLLELVTADLAGRSGATTAADQLARAVTGLRAELTGLASALEPDWLVELDEELGWLSGALVEVVVEDGDQEGRLRSVLRRERYLHLLDLLVGAVRGPRVDPNSSDLPAAETLISLLDDAVQKLIIVAGRLTGESAGSMWADAAVAAEEVSRLSHLTRMVVSKKHRREARRLRPAVQLLLTARAEAEQAEHDQHESRFVGAATAFELGRSYQRHRQRMSEAQQEFLEDWSTAMRKGKR